MNNTIRRQVLGEITPSLSPRGHDPEANIAFIPDSFLTPSPEEHIIRQRSSKFVTQATALQFQGFESDPDFLHCTPTKEGAFSHLSRKRLLLTPPDCTSSPIKLGSRCKKPRLIRKARAIPLNQELKAYTTQQLVDIIDQLVTEHPELEDEVSDDLSPPDLKPLQDNLCSLRRNIYKAIPSTRWSSSRDSHCYKRCKFHLSAFKKACVEQGKHLVLCQSWDAVLRYCSMAWTYVHQLPQWDDPSHNNSKLSCFRYLAAQCMVALKRGSYEFEQLVNIRAKLEKLSGFSVEIQPCIAQVDKLLKQVSLI